MRQGESKDVWKKESIIGSIIFLCSLAVTMEIEQNSSILMLVIGGCVYGLYRMVSRQIYEKKVWLCCGIFSFLFSQAFLISRKVHYVEMRSKMNMNYIELDVSVIITGFALAVLICPCVLLIHIYVEKISIKMNIRMQTENSHKKFFVISWGIIYVGWFPYLLSYYPGGIVGDGAITLEEALKEGIPEHNHWCVLVILTIRLFFIIASLFSSDLHFAIFLYVIVQSLLFAAVCAKVADKIKEVTKKPILAYAIVAMYALSGYFASYSMALWKDALFGAGIILMVLLLWKWAENDTFGKKDSIEYIVLGLFLCFWRNNGVYVWLISMIFICLILKKKAKHLMICGLIVIMVSLLIQGPVYKILGIEKDSVVQSFSMPIQQVAAVINSGADLDQYQENILFSVIEKEEWMKDYCPTLSDDLKADVNQVYLSGHIFEFIKVWLQLLVKHPKIYIEAYLMQTLGYWQPGVYLGNYNDYWLGIQDLFGRGWHETDWIEKMTGDSIQPLLEQRMEFIPSGTMVWLMLLSITLILAQGVDCKRRLLVMVPLVSSWVVIMIATPIAYAYRYILMLPMALPIICVLPFCYEYSEIEDRKREWNLIESKQVKQGGIVLLVLGGMITVLVNAVTIIEPKERFMGEALHIYFAGADYNATDYISVGLSGKEEGFSWTNGDRMIVEIPVIGKYNNVEIDLKVKGTFNGIQSYVVYQDGVMIETGKLDGEGMISFAVEPVNHWIAFYIEFPDAKVVREIIDGSNDGRKIAFQLQEMVISHKKYGKE